MKFQSWSPKAEHEHILCHSVVSSQHSHFENISAVVCIQARV